MNDTNKKLSSNAKGVLNTWKSSELTFLGSKSHSSWPCSTHVSFSNLKKKQKTVDNGCFYSSPQTLQSFSTHCAWFSFVLSWDTLGLATLLPTGQAKNKLNKYLYIYIYNFFSII